MPRTFILLVVLSVLSRADDPTKVAVTCPARQAPHGGSCYEVLGVRHTFAGAQAWCERHGGHLAFIPDKEKQLFLQRHLDPNQDFWFGAASCGEGEWFKLRFFSSPRNVDFLLKCMCVSRCFNKQDGVNGLNILKCGRKLVMEGNWSVPPRKIQPFRTEQNVCEVGEVKRNAT